MGNWSGYKATGQEDYGDSFKFLPLKHTRRKCRPIIVMGLLFFL